MNRTLIEQKLRPASRGPAKPDALLIKRYYKRTNMLVIGRRHVFAQHIEIIVHVHVHVYVYVYVYVYVVLLP